MMTLNFELAVVPPLFFFFGTLALMQKTTSKLHLLSSSPFWFVGCLCCFPFLGELLGSDDCKKPQMMPVVGWTFSAHWPGVQSDAGTQQRLFLFFPGKVGIAWLLANSC